MAQPWVVVDDLVFPECPRWHEDRLWFSDTHEGEVHRLDPADGSDEIVFAHSGPVAGLGFLPDGRLLVVAANEQRVLRIGVGSLVVEHAVLSPVVDSLPCNDMAVDPKGRAYVGNFGY